MNKKFDYEITIEKKKHLKYLFRQNILTIIKKLKLMKLSIHELIHNDIFDKSLPYRFG